MAWQFCTALDIGGREQQQDRVEVLETPSSDDRLIVLADGMGGYQGGELAAQAVVDCARESFTATSDLEPLVFLERLCAQAHQAVQALATEGHEAPGSTCVLLYLSADGACWAHVGDSRLYHFRNGRLLSRTVDHSVVQLLASHGKMAEAELATSPLQNQLYMRLGGDQLPNPDFGTADVRKGDLFVLCSDGFWQSVGQREFGAIVSEDDVKAASERLVQMAKERGGDDGDNISVAVARLGKAKRRFRLFS
jgi:serine/threonine protein phosphatase PrpC